MHPRLRFLSLLAVISCLMTSRVAALDLSRAIVVAPDGMEPLERKAVTLLVEEVEKRSQIRWKVQTNASSGSEVAIRLVPKVHMGSKEFFYVGTTPSVVSVGGNDPRGLLYGVGHLLRQLRITRGKIEIPDGYTNAAQPTHPIRGHQLGYRPKTHSYDAWDLATWEQYYRDLVVFGANAVELIPPRSDDDVDSPHYPLPPLQMMTGMSKLADDYGMDVWVWMPAMDKDYTDPATIEKSLQEWTTVYRALPRLDAVFVPGGDPGHTRPSVLMNLLKLQTEALHQVHPKAQMWVSPQSFNSEWLQEFLTLLNQQNPEWLKGIVFGPQVRMSLPDLRAAVPARYPIRHYPDITHTRQCQYPVPDWDTAYAITEGRECINPRPIDQAAIISLLENGKTSGGRLLTDGFITYSEGCNDDVNKAVWSAMHWTAATNLTDALREYSRYFIGEPFTESFAQGLLALERNWRGPLLANDGVNTTLHQFQEMERTATPAVKANWRFQQALFRAYYDAFLRSRLLYETSLEDRAMESLRSAGRTGSRIAMQQAESHLNRALTEPVATDLRARVFELGDMLFQSIRMQLSVPRHQAIGVDRGASLDTADYPLNNRRWLLEQFERVRKMTNEVARLQEIDRIVNWTNPGPGGFYDDTGNIARQPHVVRNLPFAKDPASLKSSKVGFEEGDVTDEPGERPDGAVRMSWLDHAESLIDEPLTLHYDGLDRSAAYKVRVMYVGDAPAIPIRLVANGTLEVHKMMTKPFKFAPLEFDIPRQATTNGALDLQWTRPPGLGGNGRGCQVSEVWLIRK